MSIDRKETTRMLLDMVIEKTSKPGVYGAKEIAIDWGTIHPRYVDYMTFSPANTVYVSGVEKGIFTCYEIKSCYEDLYSGKGLNFIGEKNYLVTTAETYKRIRKDIETDLEEGISSIVEQRLARHIRKCNPESKCRLGYDIGLYVPIPKYRSTADEIEDPTPLDETRVTWELRSVLPCHESSRTRSMTEMLFLMLKAAYHK